MAWLIASHGLIQDFKASEMSEQKKPYKVPYGELEKAFTR